MTFKQYKKRLNRIYSKNIRKEYSELLLKDRRNNIELELHIDNGKIFKIKAHFTELELKNIGITAIESFMNNGFKQICFSYFDTNSKCEVAK
jgi:hypothetical protein